MSWIYGMSFSRETFYSATEQWAKEWQKKIKTHKRTELKKRKGDRKTWSGAGAYESTQRNL